MKVMIGLSGGVDSAVAAYLLKKEGYEVVGCFMRNWDAFANNDYLGNPTINDDQCPQEKDYQDALKVAKQLDIPLLRVDFIKEYWDHVFSFFVSEYQNGRTPNPDILCNKYIKFDAFLNYAKSQGIDMIAMGHYAKRIYKDGHYYLMKCFDENKDQTYFLSQINEEQIKCFQISVGDTRQQMKKAIAGIAASGTVTVEAAMLGLPLVVSYKVSWLTYQVAKALVKLPSITIANLVTGQTVYEERLQYDAVPDKLAKALDDILPGGSRRQTCLDGIEKCVKMLGEDTKASARAAEAVLEVLEGRAGDL